MPETEGITVRLTPGRVIGIAEVLFNVLDEVAHDPR